MILNYIQILIDLSFELWIYLLDSLQRDVRSFQLHRTLWFTGYIAGHLLIRNGDAHRFPCCSCYIQISSIETAQNQATALCCSKSTKKELTIKNNWQCQIWWLVSMSHKWLRKFAPPWQNIHRWWLYLNKSPRVGAGLVWFGSSSFDLDLGERNANQVVAGFL